MKLRKYEVVFTGYVTVEIHSPSRRQAKVLARRAAIAIEECPHAHAFDILINHDPICFTHILKGKK
jgi:hypothetical protein